MSDAAQLAMFDDLPDPGDAAPEGGEPRARPVVSKGPPRTKEEHLAAMYRTVAHLERCATCPWSDFEVRLYTGIFNNRAEWQEGDIAEALLERFRIQTDRLDLAHAPPDDGDWMHREEY